MGKIYEEIFYQDLKVFQAPLIFVAHIIFQILYINNLRLQYEVTHFIAQMFLMYFKNELFI